MTHSMDGESYALVEAMAPRRIRCCPARQHGTDRACRPGSAGSGEPARDGANPARIAVSPIRKMRRKQCVEAVVR